MKMLSPLTPVTSQTFTVLLAAAGLLLTTACSTTNEAPRDPAADRAAYEKFERKVEGIDRRYPYAVKSADSARR